MAAHCDWSGGDIQVKYLQMVLGPEHGDRRKARVPVNKPPTSYSNTKGEKSSAAISDKPVKSQEKKISNLLDITHNVMEGQRLRADSEPVQRTNWKSLSSFLFWGRLQFLTQFHVTPKLKYLVSLVCVSLLCL